MRIISLVPSATETLFALGLGDDIVGITRFCCLPAQELESKARIGGTKNPKLDRIVALKPDIVVMDQDENRKEDADFLRERGVRIYVTFCRSVTDAIAMVMEMGTLFESQQKAAEISDEMKHRMETFRKPDPQKTLILIWRRPYMTVNADTYVHSICDFFGFSNTFAFKHERYPKLKEAEIRKADPEVVLFPDEPYPFREKHVAAFCTEFADVIAVRNRKLILLDGKYLTWHGYGTLRALRNLSELVNAGFEPTTAHRQRTRVE